MLHPSETHDTVMVFTSFSKEAAEYLPMNILAAAYKSAVARYAVNIGLLNCCIETFPPSKQVVHHVSGGTAAKVMKKIIGQRQSSYAQQPHVPGAAMTDGHGFVGHTCRQFLPDNK